MALTATDRKNISKKIIDIPDENQASQDASDALQDLINKLMAQDTVNKNIFDPLNVLINGYHAEFALVNGESRTSITESQIIDSAKKTIGNAFFPNDFNVPIVGTPPLSDGVWKEFKAYAGSFAVGRIQTGATGPTVTKEQDLIDLINTTIASVEASANVNRVTGQECGQSTTSGTCAGEGTPPQLTQATCEADGGTWTGDDEIRPDPVVQGLLSTLKTQVQTWEDFLNTEFATVTSPGVDSDITRNTQNITARSDITSTISDIDTWQILSDFDTSHGLTTPPNTCAQFDAININTLGTTKLKPANLNTLKTRIISRSVFLITRDGQLISNLGQITQNADGTIASSTGFYKERYTALDLRINLIGGTLTGQFGGELGQRAQSENIANNNAAASLYGGTVRVSPFISPGNFTTTIHVKDNSNFNALDNVFIVSDKQPELSGQVLAKNGTTEIVLNIEISNRYTEADNARIIKEL